MASIITPEPQWVLVYDWNLSRISLDRLRENAYQVFLIPKPSYMLDIDGSRLDLSSHRDFEKLHVINTPPGLSATGHRSYVPISYPFPEPPQSTASSALPEDSASSISLPPEPETSDARLSSSIPFHDVHHSKTQSASDLSISSTNILQAISEDIIRVYPSSTGWYDATFTIRWELDQYLETELDFDPKARFEEIFESVLTITGTGNAAYATTARSYIEWGWPDDRAMLLRHTRQWARNIGCGKSFVLESRISLEGYALSSS